MKLSSVNITIKYKAYVDKNTANKTKSLHMFNPDSTGTRVKFLIFEPLPALFGYCKCEYISLIVCKIIYDYYDK